MRHLRQLSNSELLIDLKNEVTDERRKTLSILHSLLEVERRGYHLELGYSSLHEFCVLELDYDDGGAHRRIKTMRLIRAVPEVEMKIDEGKITLTNAATVQNFLEAEKKISQKIYSHEEKQKLIEDVSGLTARQCLKHLADLSPQAIPKEKQRVVSRNETEIKFVASDSLVEKLKRIKGLLVHKKSNLTHAELTETMADLALQVLEPKAAKVVTKVEVTSSASAQKSTSRYIPANLRRGIWQRDQGRCSYTNPKTKQRCGSTYALELDHIKPHCLDGENTEENLRLLCRAHNRWRAALTFGAFLDH